MCSVRTKSKMILTPNPFYQPKILLTPAWSRIIELPAFSTERLHGEAQIGTRTVRALIAYLDRASHMRKMEQLFVCFGTQTLGKPLSKQRLAHWIVESIAMTSEVAEVELPVGFLGCLEGSRAWEFLPCHYLGIGRYFRAFHSLDTTSKSVARAVLSVVQLSELSVDWPYLCLRQWLLMFVMGSYKHSLVCLGHVYTLSYCCYSSVLLLFYLIITF